ncbi:hypothetical protein GCM10027271_15730 [Saccharopolyspora gloriosae]|uniref:Multidrug resistance efflux pump n=1 Tax=Saccharopolyspora gloriosae TaxID=455344 RepID=A0A840N547_9PSEU|nr:hypothetical protein [Saccharopolyspora sp. NFXS83]MBB5067126.1 multidrug resistance efflux pump [Saccharopolyspora gloriosae]MCX2729049.1 hypothetical protein [Saccharopolyspora sp. NFXS83]
MSSLTELVAALRDTEAKLDEARQQLTTGRRALSETQAALTRLDPDHPETVVPPELSRADDQLERTLTTLSHVVETLRAFAMRL